MKEGDALLVLSFVFWPTVVGSEYCAGPGPEMTINNVKTNVSNIGRSWSLPMKYSEFVSSYDQMCFVFIFKRDANFCIFRNIAHTSHVCDIFMQVHVGREDCNGPRLLTLDV